MKIIDLGFVGYQLYSQEIKLKITNPVILCYAELYYYYVIHPKSFQLQGEMPKDCSSQVPQLL